MLNDVVNSCKFLGYAKEFEMKYMPNGRAVINTAIGVPQLKKAQDQERGEYQSLWVELALYGPVAENWNNLVSKGSQVLVDCGYERQEWTAEDGKSGVRHRFVVRDFYLTSRSSNADEKKPASPKGKSKPAPSTSGLEVDELDFEI